MGGTPTANTGKWAKAALNTTLKPAHKAPAIKKILDDMDGDREKVNEDQ